MKHDSLETIDDKIMLGSRLSDAAINEIVKNTKNNKNTKAIIWEWYNNVDNTGWEEIMPSDMDAIIAHGLKPDPRFRKIALL